MIFAQWLEPMIDDGHFNIIDRDIETVVNTDQIDDDPLRKWTYTPVKEDNFVGADELGDNPTLEEKEFVYDNNFLQTTALIRRILNYVLWFLWLITLTFLIYWGIRLMTSSEEETAEETMKKIRTAFISLWGIALSWFIVTFLFYVISLLVA